SCPLTTALLPVLAPALLLGSMLPGPLSGRQADVPPAARGAGSWDDLYRSAFSFQDFLAEAERRTETWHGNYDGGTLDDALLAQAGRIPGAWRLLVVAEDWCGDSANTLPYVARLGEALENLEVRVVNSEVGRGVMEAYPTPDGRGATPTMLLLAPDGAEAGCLVEQPHDLQTWWLGEARQITDEEERFRRKYAWYEADGGESTVREVVALMEAAAGGMRICRAGAPLR
ncbi:MAG: thioredoxin family protein, partial [Longimicrobiales bacterium]|nr:thioredoxin family protein [Longimicrobiales bacterium]